MPTTNEELAAKVAQVEKLRAQVASAEDTRISRENEISNDVTMRQLEVEEARLQAQLDDAKTASKVTAVRAGASTVLDAVKADQVRADTYAKAQEAARNASGAGVDPKEAAAEAEAANEAALTKAAEANAKAPAEAATNVPEGLAESTTTEPKRGSSTVADTTKES